MKPTPARQRAGVFCARLEAREAAREAERGEGGKGPCSAAKGSGRRAYRCPAVMDGGRRTTFYSIVRLRSGFRVPAPVRIPARVWAVASGEATAFRAVIGLEVTGWRVVAVCRCCRRRRRREDRRTGRGGWERLRAAKVGSSPASVRLRSGFRLGSGLGSGLRLPDRIVGLRESGSGMREARRGRRRERSTREVAGWAGGPRQKGERRSG